MPHSMTEPSQQQSSHNKKLIPSRLDLSFTAVPYSQTYESKPPILMVPPRNPLRNAKPSPDAAAAAPAGATASPSPVSGDAGDAPCSTAGLHSVFSPLSLRQPSTSSTSPGPPEAERWVDVLQLSGYWDELDEFTEPPSHGDLDLKLTDHLSGSGPGAAGGAEEADKKDNKPALPPPPKSPEPPQAQPPKSQATESVTGEHPRRKRHFWSQIRRSRKSVSTISSEPESVPPLSPAHLDKKSRQRSSIAESESSGYSMHTPTSAECPNDVSDRLLSLHQVLATGPPGPDKDKKSSEGREKPERPATRDQTQTSSNKAEQETASLTKSHPALPGLVPQHKPLPAGELPHTLTVVIPEGRLFEDDFLDSLSF
ncbi:hypothetical protein EsDP_00006518 [Epichloe bromicola]|uniref:Uncharacterized protein n=1 Tax=Epichloe bromicola TaxID=79588 RepID=A0ABQ0CXV4_9HYPO